MSSINSINTSPPLFSLLQRINETNGLGNSVRNQISTGNRFGPEAASNFSVSQGLSADIRGYDAVGGALSAARGAGVTALAAGSLTSSLLSDATTSAILALNPANSPEQTAIYSDNFNALRSQIDNVANGANYNDTNLANGSQPGGLNTVSSPNGDQLNIASSDITTNGLTADRVAGGGQGLNDIDLQDPAADITEITDTLNNAEQTLALQQGQIATDLRAAQSQQDFNTSIQDAVTVGLGSLRDADLARADARDEQLRTQRQLQFSILNQQNQQRGSVLNLFA